MICKECGKFYFTGFKNQQNQHKCNKSEEKKEVNK